MEGVELLSPAGDFETALAAFKAGADAVYCGLGDFSARAFAVNFTYADLGNLVRVAHGLKRKVYVTFNTLVDGESMEEAVEALSRLAEIGPDALIVQDLGIARVCRRHFPELALHASTQLVAHDLEGVLELGELGFTRVVLARELSLADIASIAKRCGGIELECFIHGALCYSISGLCLFSAMEKGRSGNRGKCAYCCRLPGEEGKYPFSMKDLRLGEDVRKLAEAGVVSLKIEGRMKSALYVAATTAWYRRILDGKQADAAIPSVTRADLESIFSRRTTELYLNGEKSESPVDPDTLGHRGVPIGTVKRITKDREGRRWLRFHTSRALEKHDGLQFDTMEDGRHVGLGIAEMRPAISRTPVCAVSAGTDVEVLLPDEIEPRTGETIYCSMSNAVRRLFPTPSFRPSDWPGLVPVDVEVVLAEDQVVVRATLRGEEVELSQRGAFESAQHPDRTYAAVEKAFSKLGETDYRLGRLTLDDSARRFVPPSVLNDLRRDLVERLDDLRAKARQKRVATAVEEVLEPSPDCVKAPPRRSVRLRAGAPVPPGEWDETVYVINVDTDVKELPPPSSQVRLGLPVYTPESSVSRLRAAIRRCARAGYSAWEASDLATLRMLRLSGVTDITADWSLYAFNDSALALLQERGVRRFVASPENNETNRRFLAECGWPVTFLAQQSTPLFISLTQPAGTASADYTTYQRDGLWITVRAAPRTFVTPEESPARYDLSWDPPC